MIAVTYPSAGGQSGSNYNVPEPGDTNTQSLTDYLAQLASQGLVVPTTADLDLGASFGSKALYFKTRTANPAASGVLRAAAADTAVAWRNAANNGDVGLSKDAGDQLLFNGKNVTGNPMLGANTTAGQSIANGATYVIIVYGTVEVDTDSAYNAGTGRYTVPTGKGGHYQIVAVAAYDLAQTGNVDIAIHKNATEAKTTRVLSPGAIQVVSVSAIMSLSAGDIIDIRTRQPAVGAQALNAGAVVNYFAIKRIPT